MSTTAGGLLASTAEAAAADWVRRKLGDARHERRVLAIASRLFDLLGPTLGLGEHDAELLRLAALTHDIGRSISEKDHPADGAEMIARTTAVDFSAAQRRRLSFLARYHRGAVPPPHKEEYLGPTDPRNSLRAVLAILRTADSLDHRHLPTSQLTLSLQGRRLSIRCGVPTDLPRARRVYKRRKKYRLLETFLGQSVRVDVELASA